jgi:hypothetical protein
LAIASIQILDTAGNVIHAVDPAGQYTVSVSTLANSSAYQTIQHPMGLTSLGWFLPSSSPANNRWTVRSGGTSSNGTGPNSSIASLAKTSPLPAGIATVPQAGSGSYLYRESSGNLMANLHQYVRTASLAMPAQGYVRICYHNYGGFSGTPTGYDIALYMGT